MSPTTRPTEWTALATALAFLIAHALGVDNDQTMAAMIVVLGFVPAVVTWVVVTVRKRGN